MTRKVNIPVMIFALVASFISGFEISNEKHEATLRAVGAADQQMLATIHAREAAQAEQIAALNKLALVWQTRATACEQEYKPAGEFLRGALDVLQGARR